MCFEERFLLQIFAQSWFNGALRLAQFYSPEWNPDPLLHLLASKLMLSGCDTLWPLSPVRLCPPWVWPRHILLFSLSSCPSFPFLFRDWFLLSFNSQLKCSHCLGPLTILFRTDPHHHFFSEFHLFSSWQLVWVCAYFTSVLFTFKKSFLKELCWFFLLWLMSPWNLYLMRTLSFLLLYSYHLENSWHKVKP